MRQDKTKYKILSIDAWRSGTKEEPSWDWNNWYIINTYHESEYGELTEETALLCFADKLVISLDELKTKAYINDDQYNLVLMDKLDHRPLYAIEYGGES
jgi:hypothetical protein